MGLSLRDSRLQQVASIAPVPDAVKRKISHVWAQYFLQIFGDRIIKFTECIFTVI
jgi:hypothetical protein